MPLTADRAKPAVPVRRRLPAGRLRAEQPGQRRLPADRRADPVQVTQPRPAHRPGLADVARCSATTSRRCRPSSGSASTGTSAAPTRSSRASTWCATSEPDIIVVVGADHVYRMDFSQMVDAHIECGAGLHGGGDPAADLASRPVRRDRGRRRGPAPDRGVPGEADATRRGWRTPRTRCWPRWATTSSTPRRWSRRSPRTPRTRAPSTTWAATSCRTSSTARRRRVYDFKDNDVPGSTDRDRDYWRDVGTLDAYFEAQMDLVSVQPVFNLYNYDWPLYTHQGPWPPAKFVHGWQGRIGHAVNSIVSPGSVVSGSLVENSVLSPNVDGALLGDGQRQRADGQRRRRPARGGPPGDPGQERRRPGGRPDRRWTPTRTAPAASTSPTPGSPWSARASDPG